VAHPRARLTVFRRQLLIARVEAGWPAAHVAEQLYDHEIVQSPLAVNFADRRIPEPLRVSSVRGGRE
jgi:hypothetical protein